MLPIQSFSFKQIHLNRNINKMILLFVFFYQFQVHKRFKLLSATHFNWLFTFLSKSAEEPEQKKEENLCKRHSNRRESKRKQSNMKCLEKCIHSTKPNTSILNNVFFLLAGPAYQFFFPSLKFCWCSFLTSSPSFFLCVCLFSTFSGTSTITLFI